MAIRIDVVVVVIDRGVESPTFNPFVGMLVGSCFKARPYYCSIPTKWTKAVFSSTLSIITKKLFIDCHM